MKAQLNLQTMFFGMMLALTVLVLAFGLVKPIQEQVDISINSSNLDCTNSSISAFDRSACVVAEISPFYFIGGIIFLAGALITAKIIVG